MVDVPRLVPSGTKVGKTRRTAHTLRAQMVEELHKVAEHFRLRYGPIEWKRTRYGWDVDAAEASARKEIDAIVSDTSKSPDAMVAAFQEMLSRFVNGTHDYHVSISFTRLAQARLPFRVQPSDGRFFIRTIDRKQLPKSSFPFEVGDEIIRFGGKPTAEVVTELQKYIPSSNPLTDIAEAATMLTARRSRVAEPLPTEPTVTFTVKRKDGTVVDHQLAWTSSEEKIHFNAPGNNAVELRSQSPKREKLDMTAHRFIDRESLAAAKANGDVDPFAIGGRRTFLPNLGEPIFRTDEKNPFDAYIYRAPNGKNVGVIRIPEYGVDEPAECVAEFAKLIEHFEKNTDALVIDQNNNPGGYFYYMMALLSMLSPQPLVMPSQQEKITAQEAYDARVQLQTLADVKTDKAAIKALGKDLAGYPVSLDLVTKIRTAAQHQVDQFEKQNLLTDAFPLEGLGAVNPSSKTTYSKPILCLVNATCYSCGDFFPSALQQNKRAVIMGERTAGAGGYVLTHRFVNSMGIEALRVTGSIADRPHMTADGKVVDDPTRAENPIENVAVVPDVPYSLTPEDHQNGFVGYRDAVNAQVVKMTS